MNTTKKYPLIDKKCPVCETLFTTQMGHPKEKRTCSYSCSNKFFNRQTLECRRKKSLTALNNYKSKGCSLVDVVYKCGECNEIFRSKKRNRKFCSNRCSQRNRVKNPEYIKKLSDAVQKNIKNGNHKGWSSRKIISYPEKFFMKVLDNNNIKFAHNKKEGKYFIDFAIESKRIALEIDGRQHKMLERIESDKKKDDYLTNINWNVYRIDWNEVNSECGKKMMKDKIDKFLEFLNSTAL